LAWVFVTLRFYCRVKLVRKVWWDDWLILASVCFTTAMSIVWTIYAANGGCRHAASLTNAQLITVGRLNWISQPLCVAGLTTGKISVACLILRLQSPTRWRTRLLFGLCSLMCAINIVVVVLMFTQCTPVTLLWDPSSASHGHCFNPRVVSVFSQSASSYMAFLDLILAGLPVHMIWTLKMRTRKKVAICLLLSTGISAFGFAVIKIIELGNDSNHQDLTWATVLLFVWNAFEINIVIIAACTPALVPLFEILTGRKSSSQFSKKPSGGSYSLPSLRNRARLNSTSKSDTESATDILAPKNKITISAHHPASDSNDGFDEISGGSRIDSKIAITKQWSIRST